MSRALVEKCSKSENRQNPITPTSVSSPIIPSHNIYLSSPHAFTTSIYKSREGDINTKNKHNEAKRKFLKNENENNNETTKNKSHNKSQNENKNKEVNCYELHNFGISNSTQASSKNCEMAKSFVNVFYFKKLKINKKLVDKLKNKNILIYLKYNDSESVSDSIEITNEESNNLFLCFLVTEPFNKNEKQIIKIYIKYYKNDKYKILSFGFIDLNYLDFSEKFYKKKCHLFCYDKNNKKYLFGHLLLILANQKKWKIQNEQIVYEQVKNSYFVFKKHNYDKQIFYICRKIQKILLDSNNFSLNSSFSRNALLKHFSVTQSCPSTFCFKDKKEEINKKEKNYEKYYSLIDFKKPEKYKKKNDNDNYNYNYRYSYYWTQNNKTTRDEICRLTKGTRLVQKADATEKNDFPKIEKLINDVGDLKKETTSKGLTPKEVEADTDVVENRHSYKETNNTFIGEKEKKEHIKNENVLEQIEQGREETQEEKERKMLIENKTDLLFCVKLQNILNNNVPSFVEEILFILKHLKKKIVKKKKYFQRELNAYKGDLKEEKEKREETKNEEDEEENEMCLDIIHNIKNCVDVTLLYIEAVLKDTKIKNYEKEKFCMYKKIINNIDIKLSEYIEKGEYLKTENISIQNFINSLYNANDEKKKRKSEQIQKPVSEEAVDNKEAKNEQKQKTKFCSLTNSMDKNSYDETVSKLHKIDHTIFSNEINLEDTKKSMSTSSIDSYENFDVHNYMNEHISIALKYYQNKWKTKLLNIKKYL